MKVLDVHGFHTGTKEIQKNIKLLQEQIEAIREAVHQIIHLEDSLKGKGGESIRNYYQHIHETFLQFFQSFLTNYDTIIGEMQHALQQFEPAENGFIHEGFIDMNVPQGLKKIRDITESLTNEANQIMASVQDIVSLPRLQDEATLRGIEQGRVRAKKTIEDLYFFDRQATRTLDSVEKDIQTMTAFVQQANAMFEGDKRIVIDFNPEKLKEGEGYRNLVAELYPFTEEEIDGIRDYLIRLQKGEIEGDLKNYGDWSADDVFEGNILPYRTGQRPELDPKIKGVLKFGLDFFAEDILTLFDSEASVKEKGIALAMMLPQGKVLKAADKLKDIGEAADKIRDASDQVMSVTKGTDNTSKKVHNGEQFTKVDGKKALKPNIEYTTTEGYHYKTDNSGRISSVEATLQLGKAERNQYAQRTVGGNDRLPNDDGGHLIASIFKGSGEIDNLVPMNATLNRSEYKTLENTWKKALEEGKDVTIKVKPIYEGKSTRPTEFKINYSIDGKKYSDRLINYAGGK